MRFMVCFILILFQYPSRSAAAVSLLGPYIIILLWKKLFQWTDALIYLLFYFYVHSADVLFSTYVTVTVLTGLLDY